MGRRIGAAPRAPDGGAEGGGRGADAWLLDGWPCRPQDTASEDETYQFSFLVKMVNVDVVKSTNHVDDQTTPPCIPPVIKACVELILYVQWLSMVLGKSLTSSDSVELNSSVDFKP